MFLVAGLGNPGRDYQCTRHNIGFEAVDYLADYFGVKMNKVKHKAIVGSGVIGGEKVIFAKPQTYMNLSGESIREIRDFYKMESASILVIYDDIALDTGKIRIRPKGSDGGHNGMKSIIYQLADDAFHRVRIGIGAPRGDLVNYVLERFSKEEIAVLEEAIKKLPDIVTLLVEGKISEAMNRYNGN